MFQAGIGDLRVDDFQPLQVLEPADGRQPLVADRTGVQVDRLDHGPIGDVVESRTCDLGGTDHQPLEPRQAGEVFETAIRYRREANVEPFKARQVAERGETGVADGGARKFQTDEIRQVLEVFQPFVGHGFPFGPGFLVGMAVGVFVEFDFRQASENVHRHGPDQFQQPLGAARFGDGFALETFDLAGEEKCAGPKHAHSFQVGRQFLGLDAQRRIAHLFGQVVENAACGWIEGFLFEILVGPVRRLRRGVGQHLFESGDVGIVGPGGGGAETEQRCQEKTAHAKPSGQDGSKRLLVQNPVKGAYSFSGGSKNRLEGDRRFFEPPLNDNLLEAFQHLRRHELHAGIVPVVAIVGKNAAILVVGIVRFPVGDERLAQVVVGQLFRLDDLPLNRGEFFELGIILVGAVVLFADAGQGALNDLDLLLLQTIDEFLQARFEHVLVQPAGVVAADLDDHDGRLLRQHVLVEAFEQIGNGVASRGDPIDLNAEVGVRFVQRFLDDLDVALGNVFFRLVLAAVKR